MTKGLFAESDPLPRPIQFLAWRVQGQVTTPCHLCQLPVLQEKIISPGPYNPMRGRIVDLRPSFAFTLPHWTLWAAHFPFVPQTKDVVSITVSSFRNYVQGEDRRRDEGLIDRHPRRFLLYQEKQSSPSVTPARFLEKEKGGGSTNSQSGQHEKPSQNSVTTEEGETVTSSTTCTSTRVSGSQSDKSSSFSKRSDKEKPPPLTEDYKSLHRKKTVTSSFFKTHRSILFFLPFSFVLQSSSFLPPLLRPYHLPRLQFSSTFSIPLSTHRFRLTTIHHFGPFFASGILNSFYNISELLPCLSILLTKSWPPNCCLPHIPNFLTGFLVLYIFLASSYIYVLFHISCTDICLLPHTTRFDASYSRSPFQQNPLFFRLSELFTVFPFLY